jgi:hypothetical protein
MITLCVLFYLVPAAIAVFRAHRNAMAILVLNFLLGWTFLGWLIALVWAFTSHTDAEKKKMSGLAIFSLCLGYLILFIVGGFWYHATH